MNNFLILHLTRLLYRFMHKIPILSQSQCLANMCLDSMSMAVCHHIATVDLQMERKPFFIRMTIFGNVRI